MNDKELNYSAAFKVTREDLIFNGIEAITLPLIVELFHSSKEEFVKMILANIDNTYQFTLTIKELNADDQK